VASDLLLGYQGCLQTDDYGGYNAVTAGNRITQLGCWAHARRKFVDAQKVTSNPSKANKADMAIAMIAKLYTVERRIAGLTIDERMSARQQDAAPVLKTICAWLDKTLHTTLPKDALGRALAYLDRNWRKLTVYIEDSRLSIDNNPAENAIHPFVIGRKNGLFSASVDGAKASTNLYGLIETAKANGPEAFAYLQYVVKELPVADSVEAMEALLPWRLSPAAIAIGA